MMIKNFFKWFLFILAAALLTAWLISLFAPKNKTVEYGVTFSAPYAQNLGLDWKQTYLDILNNLQPKYLRLSAYWNSVEPTKDEYDFEQTDFQVNQAESHNTKVVLAVGRRLPRWPECHDPDWIKDLSGDDLKNAQYSYVAEVINRYKNNPSITAWQVENEPFLESFGICPTLDKSFLDGEITLVKQLDPDRPVIITDSGELSFWFYAGTRGDIFGSTFYRYVFSDVFKRYWTNHIPAIYYRFKGGLLTLMHPGKKIVIMELEAEPWTTKGITSTSIDDQFKTMSLDHFNTIVTVAKTTGFSPQYLWGVEWWYWMKNQGHPEFWEKAKVLFNN